MPLNDYGHHEQVVDDQRKLTCRWCGHETFYPLRFQVWDPNPTHLCTQQIVVTSSRNEEES